MRALRYLTVCAMDVFLVGHWLHLMASLLEAELWRDYRSAYLSARAARIITVHASSTLQLPKSGLAPAG